MEYKSKPVSYIASLLGHEGEGSALALLKQRGLAESLSAGGGFTDDYNAMMSIRVGLTQRGVNEIEQIGKILFLSIALIRERGLSSGVSTSREN